jgi:2-iminobutanoate/2-iminopropanoate deaminase
MILGMIMEICLFRASDAFVIHLRRYDLDYFGVDGVQYHRPSYSFSVKLSKPLAQQEQGLELEYSNPRILTVVRLGFKRYHLNSPPSALHSMLRIKQVVNTDKAPKPAGPYSQGITANGFVFVAGQVGIDPRTRTAPQGIAAQTRQCLNNVKAVVESSGATMDSVVRVGVYLRSIQDFAEMNKVYEEFFKEFPPVRTTIQAVLAADYLIEIDAIALKS